MSEDTLRAITDQQMRSAVGVFGGKLSGQRRKAMQYYLCEPTGDLSPPEVEGRSTVVSPDVRNTIESMLPQLMVKFAGTERVVEFEPNKPGDEAKSDQATDFIGYIYHQKNDGEGITYRWMKDALLSKVGVIKVWWDDTHVEKREDYRGLNEAELAELMDDDEIEVTEAKSYPDEDDAEQRQDALKQIGEQMQQAMQPALAGDEQAAQAVQQMQAQIEQIQSQPPVLAFDVTCKRANKCGQIRVDNVPPEEFLISREAKTIDGAKFVGHRVLRTMSDLKSQGYKNLDNIGSDEHATTFNSERIERLAFDDEYASLSTDQHNTSDESQRQIWLTECYVRVDFDGDGISELRKVVRAGNQILENEIIDCAPFVSICPVPMPHKFFGLSIADLALESQRINTSLLRGQLDNNSIQVNGRFFAVDGQVNLDDLVTSRPGGVVRIKQQGAVGRLEQGMGDGQGNLALMDYMKGFLEDSTGWSRVSQGNDPSSLYGSETATKTNIVTNKADMRLDLIARNFAEGFRTLFRMMLKLSSQYSDKEQVIRLRGEWVTMDPREWRNGFDTSINVGLGTGSKDQQVAHLTNLLALQKEGLMIGVATPKNIYQSGAELIKAMGFKNADKFLTDPAQSEPKPPPPDPEQIKAQAAMQLKQMELDADAQKFQAQTQLNMQRIQLESEAKRAEQQAALQVQAANDERDAQREQMRAQLDAELKAQEAQIKADMEMQRLEYERWKTELDNETKVLVAQIGVEGALRQSALAAQSVPKEPGEANQPTDMNAALTVALEGFREAIGAMRAPRSVVRDSAGRISGVI